MLFGLTTVFTTYGLVRLYEHYQKKDSHLLYDKIFKKKAQKEEPEGEPEDLLIDKTDENRKN
ncbi:MAG: hypothetical protein ABFS05_14005, partial [Bacteroidota bacterium]